MEVRPVRSDEWRVFRDLRVRALADAPDAFRVTYEAAAARTDRDWADMVRFDGEQQVTWVVEHDGAAVGQAFSRRDGSRLEIFSMWVAPEGRGKGLGRSLLDAAESWGREAGCTTAYLSVTDNYSPAQRLYHSAGYRPTGADEPLREGSSLTCVELSKEL